jgi:hypothetical protein
MTKATLGVILPIATQSLMGGIEGRMITPTQTLPVKGEDFYWI